MSDPVREGRARGRRARWVDTGGPADRPALLLLHGSGIDDARLGWGPVIDRLGPEMRVVVPDLPGYGGTEPVPEGGGVRHGLGWLEDFLEVAELPSAAVAGLSMGGALAIGLALRRPSAVRALAPVASYGLSARHKRHPVLRWLRRAPSPGLSFAAIAGSRAVARGVLVQATAWATPDAATIDAFRAAAAVQARRPEFSRFLKDELAPAGYATDWRPRLPELRMPTAILHGRRDGLIPFADAEAAASLIPDARLVPLEAGHWPPREVPDEVAAALRDLVAAIA